MRAGDLRRQMVLQSRTPTLTENGQEAYTWTTVANVWASIRPLGGRELEMARAVQSESTHIIEIRYRENINAKMRLTYGGKIYNITGTTDVDMRHRTLELTCIEGLNEG